MVNFQLDILNLLVVYLTLKNERLALKKASPILMHHDLFIKNPILLFNFPKYFFPVNNIQIILELSYFSSDVLQAIRNEHFFEYKQNILSMFHNC